jgi:hypothetical protein
VIIGVRVVQNFFGGPKMMSIEKVKRKKQEKVSLDELGTSQLERKKERKTKKKRKEPKKDKARDDEEKEQLATCVFENEQPRTPILCWKEPTIESPVLTTFSLPNPFQQERNEEEEREHKSTKEGEAELTNISQMNTLWPVTTKEWWIHFVLMPKFQERLSVSWKNLAKGFRGSLLMPYEVFLFFFGALEKKIETESKIKKLIQTQQNFEQVDQILLTSEWRKKSFYHQDTVGAIFQGTCEVVLEVEKKVDWAGGGFITCASPLELMFEKKNSLFSFSGVVEGRNKVQAFRF